MSNPDEYNGWSNRETWAVALHINNDQGWQESVYEALREAGLPNGYDGNPKNLDRVKAVEAGDYIRENVEETLEPMEDSDLRSFHGSVILTQGQWSALHDIGSLWRVDWTELGASFLNDLKDEHPADCRFCAAGEPMRHTYEPPLDES